MDGPPLYREAVTFRSPESTRFAATLGRHSPSIQYAEGVSQDGMAESL